MIELGKKYTILKDIGYLILLTLLAVFTFSRALDFTFWRDDWAAYWGALHKTRIFYSYWLHPATTIEFIVLTKFLGLQIYKWQIFGLFLKIVLAYVVSKMVLGLTKSSLAGFLSGIFMAVSVIGLEATSWVSAHVAAVDGIFVCLSVYFATRLRKAHSAHLLVFICWFILALVSDPGRTMPLVLIIILLFYFFPHYLHQTQRKRLMTLCIMMLGGLIAYILYTDYKVLSETVVITFLSKYLHNPWIIVRKYYVIGNYFNSLANLMVGWIMPMSERMSTGIYHRVLGRAGILVLAATCFLVYTYVKKRNKTLGIYIFFMLWIFIFYIPNWFFEPRSTLTSTHRYMVISGIGFIGLLSFVLTQMKSKMILVGLTLCFIIINIRTSKLLLGQYASFRSRKYTDRIWDTIDQTIPKDVKASLFMFEGSAHLNDLAVGMSGEIPYALRRNLQYTYEFPFTVNDESSVIQYLCKGDIIRNVVGERILQKGNMSLSNIYAWQIHDDGTLTQISENVRDRLREKATALSCKIVE